MKPIHLGLLAVAVLLVGFFIFDMRSDQSAPAPTPAEPVEEAMPTEEAMEVYTVELAEQNDLGQSGQAVISENEAGMAVVSLSLSGGEFPEPQPAHIHLGACPDPGPVEYPLTSVVDGQSETVLDVSYDDLLQSEEAMAVNVHKSAAEASVYTACGDLD